jgi:hypothetical protein
MDNKDIEFNIWLKNDEIKYMFSEGPYGSGTFAYIRGPIEPLKNFIKRLYLAYRPGCSEQTLERFRQESDEKLVHVLETGEEERDVMVSSDDRIRVVSRLDSGFVFPDQGPWQGSSEHLQLSHHE